MKIVDLSVPIGEATLSPPSVNLELQLTSYHRGPGFWQASKIEMLLHTGSHVDFSKHTVEDGETAVDVALDHFDHFISNVDRSGLSNRREFPDRPLEECRRLIKAGAGCMLAQNRPARALDGLYEQPVNISSLRSILIALNGGPVKDLQVPLPLVKMIRSSGSTP